MTERTIPTCGHPERKNRARLMCASCYKKAVYDPVKERERGLKWRAKNYEKTSAHSRKWRAENPEKQRECIRKYKERNPGKGTERSKKWRLENVDKDREIKRDWNRNNPIQIRNRRLLSRYNLTPEKFQEMFIKQNGLCQICKEMPAKAIDHNHGTGEVRALLCTACNFAIGAAREQEHILKNMIDYLKEFGANPTEPKKIEPQTESNVVRIEENQQLSLPLERFMI